MQALGGQVSANSQQIVGLRSSLDTDTSVQVFYQNDEPTNADITPLKDGQPSMVIDPINQVYWEWGIQPGSIWYDTDDQNRPHVYLDGAWQDARDQLAVAGASAISTLQTDVGTINGTLTSQATQLTTLQSNVAGNTSAITDTNTALTTATNSLTSQINTLSGSVDDASGRITNIENLNLTGSTAFAHLMTQLNVDVNGESSTITEIMDATAGLDSTWGIRTDVTTNGTTYISGIAVGVTVQSGEVLRDVVIDTGRFSVIDSQSGSTIVPFAVEND